VQLRQGDRQFALVVVAEGVRNQAGEKEKYIGDVLAQAIQSYGHHLCETGQPEFCCLKQLETRATTLGHIQRSGVPSSCDRRLAAAFGRKAVQLIEAEQYQRLVVWSQGQVDSKPLEVVMPLIKERHRNHRCPSPVTPDSLWVQTAQDLGIYVGYLTDEANPGANSVLLAG
jgi:6-phosphofructokinase 1